MRRLSKLKKNLKSRGLVDSEPGIHLDAGLLFCNIVGAI